MNKIEKHFFKSISREETLQTIARTVNARKGIFVLTGEKETGKSKLIKLLPQELSNTKIIELDKEFLNISEIYNEILKQLREEFHINSSEKDKADFLQKTAEKFYNNGENILVVLDNADSYSAKTLDNIFTLTDFKKNGYHLIQTMFVCDYSGLATLKKRQSEYEEQLISVTIDLKPFSYSETKLFVIDYLSEIGINSDKLNETDFKIIHEYTKGLAGNISKLLDLYFSKYKSVSEETIRDFSTFLSKFEKTSKTKIKTLLLTFIPIIIIIIVASIYYPNSSSKKIIVSKKSPQNKSDQLSNNTTKNNGTLPHVLVQKDIDNKTLTENKEHTLTFQDNDNGAKKLELMKPYIISKVPENTSDFQESVFTEKADKTESPKKPASETKTQEVVKQCVTLKSNLNFRKKPSTNSEVITVLSADREFIIKEKRNDWLKITFDNNTGWIYGSEEYVKISVCK